MAKRPLEIDMCAGSQLRDTQGEMLNVEGADIADLEAGRGRLNDNHGKGFFNCLGKVTSARKIFKREDCDTDRQRYYWDKVKSPYVYVKGELFDDEDHPNAKAAAAILRNIHKSDCPLKVKASVEGGVLARGLSDSSLLARTKIHSVALTFVPANQATLVEPLNLEKSTDEAADEILIKSVLHLAQTSVPSFRQITRDASATKVEQNMNKIMEMLGADAALELKEMIVRDSLKKKIRENVEMIHSLVKGIPGPESHPYEMKEGYTGADAKQAQHRAIKEIADIHGHWHQPFKMMPNENTGQPETHVMLHRGLGFNATDNPSADTPNSLKITPTHVEQPKYGVHAADIGAAGQYVDGDSPHAGVYSFWVPTSHIEAMRHYMQNRFKNPNMPNAKRWDEDAHSSGKTPDPAAYRDWEINDPQSADEGHIVVKPGKYRRVTRAEMEEMNRRGQNSYQAALEEKLKAMGLDGQFKRKGFKDPSDQDLNSMHPKLSPEPRNLMDPEIPHKFPEEVHKALTAGYGGSGAPTGLSGGGVMQSESVDLGPKKLRYITCQHCGKDQVYGKYQVKCRHDDCGKAFSMNNLEKFFRNYK
jgi:hypothetical protein